MKKILFAMAVGLLLLSGTVGLPAYKEISLSNQKESEAIVVHLPEPLIEKDNDYIRVHLEGVSTYLMSPGKPILPKVVKTMELPFGVKNVKVEVVPEEVEEYEVSKEICPAPSPLPLLPSYLTTEISYKKDERVYESSEPFPDSWYTYRVGCGINANGERVTYVAIHIFPVRYAPAINQLYVAKSAEIKISYEKPERRFFPAVSTYDLVIIAPSLFSDELERFIEHKNAHGIKTFLKTTEEIYAEYSGVDKPEQIKYFIKDAIEEFGIKYVLLVGGLKSPIFGKPRDDVNQGSKYWHVPVRYNNLYDHPKFPLGEESIYDPGVLCDLYYADIYGEGGVFEDWDTNDDGIFAAWGKPNVENDTGIDLYPDVYLGRLACRSEKEVETVVEKIIKYEESPADPSWFNRMIVVSGDGFLDQQDLDIQWDVSNLPDGEYTIYAQSINPEGVAGPVDVVHVTVDHDAETSISFSQDDHLKVDSYPFSPIAEITSPSDGDVLGNTDFFYEPTEREAYCNMFTGWANVEYRNKVMHIRGKSYDPRPYGNLTNIHVWIENSDGEIVFSAWRNNTEMYYEGEWVTGEKALQGRGGALYYMPDNFEKIILWASNGKFTGQQDVIDALSQGAGFVFLSGHGSPTVWADHYPGIPGNRQHGSLTGLSTVSITPPFLPMNKISNVDKPFVCVVGGCHNSQFNVTALRSATDWFNKKKTWCYGLPAPECWSWWITSMPGRGAIAAMGNTGLGYGILGKDCTIGGADGWITTEFFRQYGEEGRHILGEAYEQTLVSYINTFDMQALEEGHPKTVMQWVLLGDPTLMIGGYS